MRSQVRCGQRQCVKKGLISTVNIAGVNRFWRSVGVRLQKVPKPEIRIQLNVITDELQYRIVLCRIRFSRSRLLLQAKRTACPENFRGFCERDNDGINDFILSFLYATRFIGIRPSFLC